jgi:hypothetical protein
VERSTEVLFPRAIGPFYAGRKGGEDSRKCTAKPSGPCHEYGDKKAVGVEDGTKVLDYIEPDEGSNSASFKDGVEEQGVVINKNALSIDIFRPVGLPTESASG